MSTALIPQADARLIKRCDQIIVALLYGLFFLIPLFFVILTRDQFELPKLTLLRSITAIILAVWGIRIIAARRFNFRATFLDLPLLAFVSLQVVTTLTSVSHSVSWLGEYENFRGLLTVLNYVILYYVCVNFLRTRAQIDRLLLAILLSGLLTTAYGIAQFFGIDFIAWNPTSIAMGRYFSSLGNPNFLAAYLAMVMPLLVVFFVETQSRFRRVLLFLSFFAMFLCLMGTWSRGGFLGLAVSLLGLIAFGFQKTWQQIKALAAQQQLPVLASLLTTLRKHKLIVFFAVASTVLLILLSATAGRNHMQRVTYAITHFPEAITVSRLHIWGPAINIIRHHPLLGTGLDTFKTVFPRFATPQFAAIDGANVASRTAHNEILQVLATQGSIGLVIVTWLTLAFLKTWYRAYRLSQDRWRDRLLLMGLFGSWLAYSVQNIFSFGVVVIDTFYWLILAVSVLMQTTPDDQVKLAPSQTPDAKPLPVFAWLSRFRSVAIPATLVIGAILVYRAWVIFAADFAYNVGSYYRMQNHWEKTLQEFSTAARLVPHEVKYIVYKGLAYEEKAKSVADPEQQRALVQQAIATYTEGVRLNPTNAYYLGNLGRAYALAADLEPTNAEFYARAVEFQKRAVAYAPVTVLFYQNLALLYLTHKDEENFQRVLNDLAGFDKPEAARLSFTAANSFYSSQILSKAKQYYENALRLNPNYVEAYFNLGVTVAQLSSPAQAVELWRQALVIKPDFEPAQQMLLRYAKPGSISPSTQSIIGR